jgi:cell division protein FtsW
MNKAWIKDQFKGDPVIWGIIALLGLISILAVYSATGALAYRRMEGNTEYFLIKQSSYILFGIAFVWVAHKIDYRYYSKLSIFALLISIPLLILTIFVGSKINDASRWISIFGLSFQPSDFAKLSLIAFLASRLSKMQSNPSELNKEFIQIILAIVFVCGLIGYANMSNAIMLVCTCFLIMLIGRIPFKYFALLGLGLFLAGIVVVTVGQRWGTATSRVKTFVESVNDPMKAPYQAQQSYIAIATGGVLGKGPGKSDQRNILPHPYSDFIYAIIVEEYGLIGGALIVFLYLALLYRGMVTVANSNKAFGGLLSAGLSFSLVIQAMINMGVAVGLGPITGLPLPMLSMGGTSLLLTGLTLGVILSVSKGEIEEELNLAKAK